jgi:hypothetical protein
MTYTSPVLATVGYAQALVLGFSMEGPDSAGAGFNVDSSRTLSVVGLDD